jgi:predicted ATP-grasp superfamily ATP-dependent carboligase
VKTDVGNSAKGVAIVTSREECLAQFDALVRRYGLEAAEWPMIQAFAGGDPHGVCLLYNRGQLRASFTERYLRAKDGTVGTSVFRESVHAPVLEEQARALMDGLDWHGPVHLDFLYDRTTGHSALIEINPRFWGALDLAVRAGVDFPWLLYRIAVDGDVAPVTSYRVGVRSRWIAGEMLHLFNEVRRLRMRGAVAAVRAMRGQRADGFDDFRGADPAPLAAELLYYVTRGVLTGSINPVEDGMIG